MKDKGREELKRYLVGVPVGEALITAPIDRPRGSGRRESKRSLATSFAQLARGLFDRDRFVGFGPDGDGTNLEVVTDRANGVDGNGDCFDPSVHRQTPRAYCQGDESGDGAWVMPVFGPTKVKSNGNGKPAPAQQPQLRLVAAPKLPECPATLVERLDTMVWRRRKDTSAMPAAAAI